MVDTAVDGMRTALEPWLHGRRGDDVAIAVLRRIATGNSRANWYLQMADGDRYVVRVEQGGVFGTSSAEEFRFMQAADTLGCPVAPTRWFEPTGAVIGQPFFVMDFVDGAATGRDDRSMSAELAFDFVARLHELHHIDWTSQIDSHLTPETATHAAVDRWYHVYRDETDVSIPLLEEGAAWLHQHAPPLDRVGIVHGDPGPGNFVHDGSRVIAFTDWEFTHLGDPMEDWAYLINMRGAKTMPRDAWLGLFERIAGVTVADRDLRYWSAFNYFKGACANLTCRRVFATNNPAPNMGLIGVALHQNYVRQMATVIEEL
jgi:aminoglycoside phosphotransferase (APT) family kinase protein